MCMCVCVCVCGDLWRGRGRVAEVKLKADLLGKEGRWVLEWGMGKSKMHCMTQATEVMSSPLLVTDVVSCIELHLNLNRLANELIIAPVRTGAGGNTLLGESKQCATSTSSLCPCLVLCKQSLRGRGLLASAHTQM